MALAVALAVTQRVDGLVCVVFALVGTIVSLDVTGLTLSQAHRFAGDPTQIRKWARTNAIWHSGLLSVYIAVISGLFSFSLGVLDELKRLAEMILAWFSLPQLLTDITMQALEMISEHTMLLFGVVTLFIVWHTYSAKIISRPELGDHTSLPPLAKAVYDLLELVLRFWERWKRGNWNAQPLGSAEEDAKIAGLAQALTFHAQAALVAVDMLALAALMKFLGYLDTGSNQVSLVSLVFGIVFAFAFVAAKRGGRLYGRIAAEAGETGQMGEWMADETTPPKSATSTYQWLIVALRLIEPLMIFYFVCELIGFLIFDERIHTVGFVFGALVLLLGLINKYRLWRIVNRALSLGESDGIRDEEASDEGSFWNQIRERLGLVYTKDQLDVKQAREDAQKPVLRPLRVVAGDFLEPVWRLLVASLKVLAVILASILVMWASQTFFPRTRNIDSLDTWLSLLLAVTSFLLSASFVRVPFLGPLLRLGKFFAHRTCDYVHSNRGVFRFAFGALALAAILPIADAMMSAVFDTSSNLTLSWTDKLALMELTENHLHASQVAVLFVFLTAVGELFHREYLKAGGTEPLALSETKIKDSHYSAILFVCAIVLTGIAFLQHELRDAMLPAVRGAAVSNGRVKADRFNEHLPSALPLQGQRIVLWYLPHEHNSTQGFGNVAELLIYAGAEVRISSAVDSGALARELSEAHVLVIPEQVGARAVDVPIVGQAEHVPFIVSTVERCKSAIGDFAKKRSDSRVVILEGDIYTAPGEAVVDTLEFLTIDTVPDFHKTKSGLNKRELTLSAKAENHALLKYISEIASVNGYHVFTSTNDRIVPIVTDETDKRMVAAALENVVILGLDYHQFQASHVQLLVNACRPWTSKDGWGD